MKTVLIGAGCAVALIAAAAPAWAQDAPTQARSLAATCFTCHGSDGQSVGGDVVWLDVFASDAVSTATLTYSASGLPSGLSINASTGLISGTVATGAVSPTPATVTLTIAPGTN